MESSANGRRKRPKEASTRNRVPSDDRSTYFSQVNSHLKEDYGLTNGFSSIENGTIREQFISGRAKHKHHLRNLVQVAFPCPIPKSCKCGYKTVSDVPDSGRIHDLTRQIRKKDRKYQTAPPNPLRLRFSSSSSDFDSSETENASSIRTYKTAIGMRDKCSSKTSKNVRMRKTELKSSSSAKANARRKRWQM
ncbi:hypothetical protein OESDEN_02366 [Oesophagostomum dentatum]|uniref:Uncharacterized protein n=1 Tax=Oesophagostomum dentatum TaxID=61180 RepID=A0A0B1TQM4_OESDE|nr:hypothetical protein OESDEN_02366 [Oesophagostomum dentatum]